MNDTFEVLKVTAELTELQAGLVYNFVLEERSEIEKEIRGLKNNVERQGSSSIVKGQIEDEDFGWGYLDGIKDVLQIISKHK